MIRTLYYDTAITGQFFYKPPPDGRAQPHLCRLAMLIEEGDRETAVHSMLIRPHTSWAFNPQSIAGHHITPELARDRGVPLQQAWELFTTELARADRLVAYNGDHHWQIMTEIGRGDLGKKLELPERTSQICAMRRCTSIVPPFMARPKFHNAYNFFIEDKPPLILDPAEFGAWFVRTLRDIWHGIMTHEPSE